MKLHLIFGSQSDHETYNPLLEGLKSEHETTFSVISAHRNPKELEKTLEEGDADAYIAGAGLSAHLPGVIASKVKVPVFGVPVEAQFAGFDALCSIQQMPYGIPVVSCVPGCWRDLEPFLRSWQRERSKGEKHLHMVVSKGVLESSYGEKELARTKQCATEKGVSFSYGDEPSSEGFNLSLVALEEETKVHPYSLQVPLLTPEQRLMPEVALKLFYKMKQSGGLWLGVNNMRNGVLTYLKM